MLSTTLSAGESANAAEWAGAWAAIVAAIIAFVAMIISIVSALLSRKDAQKASAALEELAEAAQRTANAPEQAPWKITNGMMGVYRLRNGSNFRKYHVRLSGADPVVTEGGPVVKQGDSGSKEIDAIDGNSYAPIRIDDPGKMVAVHWADKRENGKWFRQAVGPDD